jgi:Arf-GAP with coiled-coil, ANK repeat and PH domain-containing protein
VFYRKGYTFFYDQSAEIDVNIVMESVENLKDRSKLVDRKMQDRHSVVPKEVFQHPIGLPADSDVVMEGYLFKRATNAFKTWNRRWFQIKEDKLVC